jgi:hypothetical protein
LVKVDVSVLISTEILTISGEVKHFFEIYFSFLLASLVQAVNECKRLIIKCVLSRGSCSGNQTWTSLLLLFLRNRRFRRFGFTHMIGKSEFLLNHSRILPPWQALARVLIHATCYIMVGIHSQNLRLTL